MLSTLLTKLTRCVRTQSVQVSQWSDSETPFRIHLKAERDYLGFDEEEFQNCSNNLCFFGSHVLDSIRVNDMILSTFCL